jgi:hypothetical protein
LSSPGHCGSSAPGFRSLATGYTQWGSRAVEEDFTLIAKPYHREALAAAIRAALERENTRRRIAAAETEKTVGT